MEVAAKIITLLTLNPVSSELQKLFTTLDLTLDNIKKQPKRQKVSGQITWAKDGVILAGGLAGVRMGEILEVADLGVKTLVMQVEGDKAYGVCLNPSQEVRSGQTIMGTGQNLSLPTGKQVLGRVLDPLGKVLDGGSDLAEENLMPLESPAPGVMDRESVGEPLQTGILAIDTLIPIGRGQRELIIGDRQTGKTSIAIDTIINQKAQNVVCVYVAIGQRDSKTSQVITSLKEAGALKYTAVVSASASAPAALQYLAPYAGQAIAEYFMRQGQHVLIVFDDLSKQAVAYREISLLLRKPPGREAYPGDVFYLHSRLLERSAKLKKELGGGSITALPIIETQAGDVSAYIPTNVISITDGQIFLEPGLFYKGVRPAINVGISVSRVGGAAQTPLIKSVAGTAKLGLAQYYELAAFSQFASELDSESKKQLVRGQRFVEALKQDEKKPYGLWEEVVVLFAVMEGLLDNFEPSAVKEKSRQLIENLSETQTELVKILQTGQKLNEETKENLRSAIKEFFEK